MISKKVILTGSFGVGKSSLFKQFIFNKFDDKYITTINVVVDKKEITVDEVQVTILLWDIAGEVTQDKVPLAYFKGAHGVIYVFDLTRPQTYKNVASDLAYLRKLAPDIVVKVVGNKKDLVSLEQIQDICASLGVPCDMTTSAKTGENVELTFEQLTREMLLADD
jgi:small GTP-binding protein